MLEPLLRSLDALTSLRRKQQLARRRRMCGETQTEIGTPADEEAKLHLDIQKHASRAVLMAIEGVSILGAEQAVNGALSVIGTAIRTATGLSLFA